MKAKFLNQELSFEKQKELLEKAKKGEEEESIFYELIAPVISKWGYSIGEI